MTIPAEHLAKDLTESLGRLGERTVGYARLGTGDGSGTIVADFAYRKVYYFDRDSSQVPAIAPLVQTINLISLNNPDLEGVRIRLGYPPYNPKVLHVLGLDTGEGLDSVAGITAQEQLTAKTLYPSVGNLTNFRLSPQTPPDTTVFVNSSPFYDTAGVWSFWGGDSVDLTSTIAALSSGQHQMALICLDTVAISLVILTNTATAGGQADKDTFDWTTILSITIAVTYIPVGAVHLYFGQTVVVEDDIYRNADPRAAFGKSGSDSAPNDATFITQTHNAVLTNEQAMADLATGLVKNTTATGVQSIATPGTDYTSPTGTEGLSNKTITASSLIATALSLLIGGFKAIFTHANSADRTYTFPNASGTIALTSDIPAAGITQLTGDVGAGPGSGSQVATLATVNGAPGSFTNASLTVNGKGLVTVASNGTAPVTNVTATSPLASSGGATPDISLSGVVDNAHLAAPFKAKVVCVAAANISISSAPNSIDLVFPSNGSRILLAGQTNGAENGIWIYNGSGNALTRPSDYASGNTVQAYLGVVVYSSGGNLYEGSFWAIVLPSTTITIDTTSTTWAFQRGSFRTLLKVVNTSTGFYGGLTHSNSADRSYTFPDADLTVVGLDTVQTLTNKKFNDGTTINDSAGATGDFNVKGDTNDNLIFADVSADALGIGTNAPDASTILHVSSTTKASIPAPVMTAAQRDAISSPVEGDTVYVSDTDEHWFYDGQRWRAVGSVGWTPFAYPICFDPSGAYVGNVTLAANGGSCAIPINVPGHMLLQSVSIVNNDTASARTWGWDLYRQYLNNGNSGENTLTRVAASNGNETFTPSAASTRTLNVTSPPVYLPPGVYWLVVQCRHATNNFLLAGTNTSAAFRPNIEQTKTTTNPNGSVLDFVAATWTKSFVMTATRLDGRVFGTTSAF